MIAQNIITIVNQFEGENSEPSNESEFYILKSMWIMMLSEFEGSIKDLVESHIDHVKEQNISDIHVCLLLQNFYSNSNENITISNVITVYKKDPSKISYRNFTRDYKPKYKTEAVEKLFNTLGVFFSPSEITTLKMLDGIASTRDSIAHGDTNVQITKRELEDRLSDLQVVFHLLESKLRT
ncbi:MAG: hypothetical protein HRT37_23425 [Alteromonadaceae bacterium]|nr:hypothetical protein [Alteromonadaceae bacterium]